MSALTKAGPAFAAFILGLLVGGVAVIWIAGSYFGCGK